MAEFKKQVYQKYTTPAGTLSWPKLNAPDTKFKADGEYGTKFILPEDKMQPLIDKVQAIAAEHFKVVKADLEEQLAAATTGKKKADLKKALAELEMADASINDGVDDEGEPDGTKIANFKSPAAYTKDKGKPTEKKVPMRPGIFDATGQLIKNPPAIWGGTKAICSIELRPFYTPIAGVGVSLRLKAVQILELVSQGDGGTAESYGFAKQEGGYKADAEETTAPSTDSTTTDDSGTDGNDDF